MKTKNILAILLAIVFVSCQTNNPVNTQTQENKTNVSGLVVKEHVPVREWLSNKEESVIYYSFVDYPSGMCTKGVYNQFPEANTIMLNNRIGIRLQDSCVVDNSQRENICHIARKWQVIDKEQEDTSYTQNQKMPERVQRSPVFSFDFTTSAVEPINILRPLPTDCNPIPMCYYHAMDIEWNPDPHNPTQIMIITEWNGLNMNGISIDTTIINHRETDDDGIVTLDDHIFDGMPDGALVNIWLVRGNIVIIYHEGHPITPGDLLGEIEHDPTELTTLLHENPEVSYQLHSVHLMFGAIAHLPIFLIRKPNEPIKDRITPIYR